MDVTQILKRYSDHGRYFRGTYHEQALHDALEQIEHSDFASNIVHTFYEPRPKGRYLFIQDQFKHFLQGKVLDVGARDATLKEVTGGDCYLIDKNNTGLDSWDWERETVPFPDASFDSVVCLDTLEHVNDFHAALDDLVRVSKKYVVISLPNCWRKVFKQMLKGTGVQASYGLPPEKPMDRHKWFFNTEDVEIFFHYYANRRGDVKVAEIKYHMPMTIPRHRFIYAILKRILPKRHIKNLLVNGIFVVLEKRT